MSKPQLVKSANSIQRGVSFLILFCVSLSLFYSPSRAADSEVETSTAGIYITGAYQRLNPVYKKEVDADTIIVKNMPRIRDQGPFPTCVGCVTATIAQKYICDNFVAFKDKDCGRLMRSEEVSQLDAFSYARTNREGLTAGAPSSHQNISIFGDGVMAVQTLMNARILFRLRSEVCFPMEKLIEKYKSTHPEAVNAMFGQVRDIYEGQKFDPNHSCPGCLARINDSLASNIDADQFEAALSKPSFSEFLYKVLLKDGCPLLSNPRDPPAIDLWPKVNESHPKSELLARLRAALGSADVNRPVALGQICVLLDKRSGQTSCLSHTLVITGYKMMCREDGIKCRAALRVHNCYGAEWQSRNTDDGWIDAEHLLSKVSLDRAELSDGVISWYFPRRRIN